jgi:hypothetical protein
LSSRRIFDQCLVVIVLCWVKLARPNIVGVPSYMRFVSPSLRSFCVFGRHFVFVLFDQHFVFVLFDRHFVCLIVIVFVRLSLCVRFIFISSHF